MADGRKSSTEIVGSLDIPRGKALPGQRDWEPVNHIEEFEADQIVKGDPVVAPPGSYDDIIEDLRERKLENTLEKLENLDKKALNKRIGNT